MRKCTCKIYYLNITTEERGERKIKTDREREREREREKEKEREREKRGEVSNPLLNFVEIGIPAYLRAR